MLRHVAICLIGIVWLASCHAHAQDALVVDELDALLRRLPPLYVPTQGLPAATLEAPYLVTLPEEVLPPGGRLDVEVDEVILAEEALPPKIWSGSFELGLNGTEGNSETFNIQLGAKAKRKTDVSAITLELTHVNKSSEGKTTARNALFEGRIEWPFADTPWTWFVHGTGEYDEFKPFDLRLTGDTGIGYRFIQSDITTLIGRFGGSVSHEISGPDDAYVPEMLFGMELEHEFSPRQKISAGVEYFPDVTAFGEYRLNTNASWQIVVDPTWGLSLKLSALHRFDSTPNGAKRSDVDYSALLLWSF